MKTLSRWIILAGLLLAIAVPALAQEETILYEGQRLSLEIPTTIASDVNETVYEAMPYEETLDMPLWAVSPMYWEYELLDYPNGDRFFRPATIAVYDTAEFEAYTLRDDSFPYGYGIELEKLTELLADQPDLSEVIVANTNGENDLPYLPLANAAQVFRAQPTYLEFQNGVGVRYLVYYSQAVNPIVEGDIFYTFQGLSADGSTYISVNFPLLTGVFPDETPSDLNYDEFAANYEAFLEESLAALDGQDESAFSPTLAELDAIVQSILVNP